MMYTQQYILLGIEDIITGKKYMFASADPTPTAIEVSPVVAPAPVAAPVVVSDSSMPKELVNPPAVLIGAPQSAASEAAPQTAGLFGGDMKTVAIIAGAFLILGLLKKK